MGILEFIFGIIALFIGGFVIIITASIIADYKTKEKIKKEYKESKNFKEEN